MCVHLFFDVAKWEPSKVLCEPHSPPNILSFLFPRNRGKINTYHRSSIFHVLETQQLFSARITNANTGMNNLMAEVEFFLSKIIERFLHIILYYIIFKSVMRVCPGLHAINQSKEKTHLYQLRRNWKLWRQWFKSNHILKRKKVPFYSCDTFIFF